MAVIAHMALQDMKEYKLVVVGAGGVGRFFSRSLRFWFDFMCIWWKISYFFILVMFIISTSSETREFINSWIHLSHSWNATPISYVDNMCYVHSFPVTVVNTKRCLLNVTIFAVHSSIHLFIFYGKISADEYSFHIVISTNRWNQNSNSLD